MLNYFLQTTGPIGYLILTFSILSLTAIIFKFISFTQYKLISLKTAEKIPFLMQNLKKKLLTQKYSDRTYALNHPDIELLENLLKTEKPIITSEFLSSLGSSIKRKWENKFLQGSATLKVFAWLFPLLGFFGTLLGTSVLLSSGKEITTALSGLALALNTTILGIICLIYTGLARWSILITAHKELNRFDYFLEKVKMMILAHNSSAPNSNLTVEPKPIQPDINSAFSTENKSSPKTTLLR